MTTLFPIGERNAARCSLCGKSLTDPVSVARGVGPVCCPSQPKPAPVEHPTLPGIDEPIPYRESIAALLREAIGLIVGHEDFIRRAEKALEEA